MDLVLKIFGWLANKFFDYEKAKGGLKDFLSRRREGKTQKELYDEIVKESEKDKNP